MVKSSRIYIYIQFLHKPTFFLETRLVSLINESPHRIHVTLNNSPARDVGANFYIIYAFIGSQLPRFSCQAFITDSLTTGCQIDGLWVNTHYAISVSTCFTLNACSEELWHGYFKTCKSCFCTTSTRLRNGYERFFFVSGEFNGGLIAGAVIGSLLFVVAIILLFIYRPKLAAFWNSLEKPKKTYVLLSTLLLLTKPALLQRTCEV